MKNKIIEYVNNQIGVNLEVYRTDFTKEWELKNQIIVEYRNMKRTEFRNLEILASSKTSRIRMEDIGVWGKAISYK